MRQRKAIKDTELEGLVVNGLTGVEGLAKADKWDGRSLLATPIHRLAGTGAIASSMWCLMVGPILHHQPQKYLELLIPSYLSGEDSANQDEGISPVGRGYRQ